MKIRIWIPLLALLLLSCGCVAFDLRRAQDAFNEGSAAEARQRDSELVGDAGLSGHVPALSAYQSARLLVSEQIGAHEAELRENQLLGTAYVLKALCLWRIEDLSSEGTPPPGAATEGDELGALLQEILAASQATPPLVLGTRDRVLVHALPGLRDHDRGLRATKLEGDTGAEAYFKSSLATLDSALQTVNPPSAHPVRTYVRLAQLSTLRAWQSAAFRFLDTPVQAIQYLGDRNWREKAKSILEEIEKDPGNREQVEKLELSLGISG